MNSSRQFTVIVLGLATFVGTFIVLNKARATHQLVRLKQDVKPGTVLELELFESVDVKGDDALLEGTVPWEKRSALAGMKATRLLKGGSLLFRRDVPWQENTPTPIDLKSGERTVTLEVPMSALKLRPTQGDLVDLKLKPAKDQPPRIANVKFAGWVPGKANSNGESEKAFVSFVIDYQYGSNNPLEAPGLGDRVETLEIVGKSQAR